MRRRSRSIRLGLIALACCIPRAAAAHAIGTSRGDYAVSGRVATVALVFAREELATALPELDANRDGVVSEIELQGARPAMTREIVDRLRLEDGAGTCTGTLDGATFVEGDGLSIRATYRCSSAPTALTALTASLGFLDVLSHGHRHFAVIRGTAQGEHIAYAGHAQMVISASTVWTVEIRQAAALLRLGFVRVLTTYSGLFILVLILVAMTVVRGAPRDRLLAIGAFAAGELLGLVLVVLVGSSGAGWTPGTMLAASAGYLIVENWFVSSAPGGWMVMLPFGAACGLALAGALGQLPIARSQMPIALAVFSGGVGIAQALVVMALLSLDSSFRFVSLRANQSRTSR